MTAVSRRLGSTAYLPLVALLALLPAPLAYRVSPLAPLALLVGAGFVALAVRAPGWAVPAACLLVPLESFEVPLSVFGALSPTEVAFLVVAGGYVWRALRGDEGTVLPSIGDAPVIVLLLAVLASSAVGAPAFVAGRLLVMWAAFYVVHLTVRGLQPREVRRVLLALGAGAAALGVTGIVSYLAGGGGSVADGGAVVSGRASGAIADPNYFAAYLLLAGIPALALALGDAVRRRAVVLGISSLSVVGLVLSLSRGGLLGLALAVGLLVLAWQRTRVAAVCVGLAFVAVTAVNLNPLLSAEATTVVAQRFATTSYEASANNKRPLLWSRAVGLIGERPIFGVGALQFEEHSLRLGITERGRPLANVHNTFLNIGVELGLLGLAAYLAWIAVVARALVREIRRRRPATYAPAVGVGAALAGFLLQGLTISHYQVQVVQATFFVLTAVAVALPRWADTAD